MKKDVPCTTELIVVPKELAVWPMDGTIRAKCSHPKHKMVREQFNTTLQMTCTCPVADVKYENP